jgi:hypothetical protein
MELELATNAELIQELMNRSTFAGLVLYSDEEQRFDDQIHDKFRLLTKTTAEDTIELLGKALHAVETQR